MRTPDGWRVTHTGYRRTYELHYNLDDMPGLKVTGPGQHLHVSPAEVQDPADGHSARDGDFADSPSVGDGPAARLAASEGRVAPGGLHDLDPALAGDQAAAAGGHRLRRRLPSRGPSSGLPESISPGMARSRSDWMTGS